MILPETQQIGGLILDIAEEGPNSVLYGDRAYGLTDFAKQTITIRSDMADGMKKVTLVHECLHAIFLSCGINLDHAEEERIVSAIETPVYRWLIENDFSWLKA
jgi:hypothetical protein